MPKLPFEQRTLPIAPAPLTASGEDFGAGVGRALQGAANVTAGIASQVEARQRQREAIANQRRISEGTLFWSQRMIDLANEAPEDGAGVTEMFFDEFEEWRDQQLDAVESQAARETLNAALERLKTTFGRKVLTLEAELSAAKTLDDLADIRDNHLNAVRADPTLLPDAIDAYRKMVDATTLPASRKRDMETTFVEAITFSAGRGTLDEIDDVGDARAFLTELEESADWRDNMSPRNYDTLLRETRVRIQQLEAQNNQEIVGGLPEIVRELEAGVDNGWTPDVVRQVISDPEVAKTWAERVAFAREIGRARVQARSAGARERQQMRAEALARVQEPGDFDADARYAQILLQELDAVDSALRDAPADYAASINSRIQAAIEALKDGATPEEIEEYAILTIAEQLRLGVPASQVRFLTKSMVGNLRVVMGQIPRDPEAAEQAVDTLTSLQATWGRRWPAVFSQLVDEDVLSGPSLVAARLGADKRGVAIDLMAAASVGRKGMIKQFADPTLSTALENSVLTAMEPLRSTLAFTDGGELQYNTHVDAVELLALRYMTQGVDMGAAVERAAKEVALDDYEFVGTYRVPKTVPVEPISQGATYIRSHMTNYDFVVPDLVFEQFDAIPDDRVKAIVANDLGGRGIWMTNADETGLQLLWPNGRPVQVPGEGFQPFTLTWDELRAVAPSRVEDDSLFEWPLGP